MNHSGAAMDAAKLDRDSCVGDCQGVFGELMRQDLGVRTGGQRLGEERGGAGPVGGLAEEGKERVDDGERVGRRVEGLLDLGGGAVQGRGGGDGPGERAGVAGGVAFAGRRRSEDGGDGVVESAEDQGIVPVDSGEEFGFGPAGFGGQFGEGYGEGAGGEFGGRDEVGGDGEEDGALEPELGELAMAVFAAGETGAAREAAEEVGLLGREGGDVVEGEDGVVVGELEEFAGGRRQGEQGRRGGVGEGAEDAGCEGFAAAGGAAQDEDGIWPIGLEGAEEPGEAADPIGAEVEDVAQGFEERRLFRIGGAGDGEGSRGCGGFEVDALALADLPAGGGDFDVAALGIGEVDQNLFGDDGGAAPIDAAGDADVEMIGVAGGLGFEVAADGAPGLVAGDEAAFRVGFGGEPLAKGSGGDGEGAMSAGVGGGDLGEGAAVEGGKWSDAVEDFVEDLDGFRVVEHRLRCNTEVGWSLKFGDGSGSGGWG